MGEAERAGAIWRQAPLAVWTDVEGATANAVSDDPFEDIPEGDVGPAMRGLHRVSPMAAKAGFVGWR
jgi:hypothetical protein